MSYECPISDCERTDLDSLESLQMHIVATDDESHNDAQEAKVWQEMGGNDTENDNQSDASASDDNESAEEASEETDSDTERSDSDATDEMATQEEYEEQYDDLDEDEAPEKGTSEPSAPDDNETDGSGFRVPSVSTSTLVLIGGLAVAVLLLWKLYRGSSDPASEHESPEEQTETEAESGGMAAVESGSGGVEV